jgi:tetratricopeptide (TPR) repeat protein
LLGRQSNFLRLNEHFDVKTIREKVAQLPAEKWLESERERLFDVHRDTQALLMVHFEDHKYRKPEYRELYFELQDAVAPVVDYVSNYYRNNGFVVRLILAKLAAGGKIPKHTDAGYSLLNCHRIHLPIVTNENVAFHVGGEEINMQVGELWEINNGTVHGVENRGTEDRIHLIVDWMPNHSGKPEEELLAADRLEGSENEAAESAMLGSLVRRAHRLHQSGRAAQAESLYRQVLHFDDSHVVANNLMGLLCLQTKRFDEAVQYIEKALSIAPDDAQAEANLGLALNALDRAEDAAGHFHKSLKLAPNNARAYNNLGNIYFRFRRVKDAITCYQQALAIQPEFAEVHHNLGNALMTLQRHSEAAASFRQCLALQPDFTDGRRKLEQALQALGNDQA